MSIQDWGAIGEIIGALAVVASLIYLAVQIRQNTRQISLSLESTKLAAFERNVESGNRTREILITDPDLADLFLRGASGFSDLRSTEKFRCDLLFRNLFSSLQGGYVRQLTIGGDPTGFTGPQGVVDTLVRNKGIRDWLAENEPDWRPEFAELVRERVAVFAAPAADESIADNEGE
jgi:hypothetical protein